MADQFLTLKQIESLFWRITTQIIGFDPDDPANANKVRKSWPAVGAPAWKREEDVIFIRVGESDDSINKQRDITYANKDDTNATQSMSYTRVLNVHWVCYGPNSFDRAFTLRNGLFDDQYRELLSTSQIYLIPDVVSPRRIPETFDNTGQWWERTDFAAQFNEFIQINTTVPYLQSVTVTAESTQSETTVNINSPT